MTGSGKTEVYLRAIARVVARGEQALVLVPEISLTPQLVERFAARFAAPLAVLHSGLTDAERLHAWRAARSGAAPVVIGTRSAIFAPLARPGLIVVDEEHDASYKQQEGFRYSARDLALARAQRLQVPVVLGSATPSLESLERVRAGRTHAARAAESHRRGAATRAASWSTCARTRGVQGIATPTLLAIKRHLAAGGQVLLYLNRRGYAPSLFCPGCGWVAPCPRCDARLTVHLREHALHCHHCGAQRALPATCPGCGTEVKPVGQGTERIEETLATLCPGVPLARIDRDAMRRRGVLEEILRRVHAGELRLLVGTQMLTKGHHFPDVSLVVVLNADQGLFGTDFRAAERLAQTIVQVSGRAGRAERAGEVLIQTEYPGAPAAATARAGRLRRLRQGGAGRTPAGCDGRRSRASRCCAPKRRVVTRRWNSWKCARTRRRLRRRGRRDAGPGRRPHGAACRAFPCAAAAARSDARAVAATVHPLAARARVGARGPQGALGAGRRPARALLAGPAGFANCPESIDMPPASADDRRHG